MKILQMYSFTTFKSVREKWKGYRRTSKYIRWWSLLILLLSVASIRRKWLNTTHTLERSVHTNSEIMNIPGMWPGLNYGWGLRNEIINIPENGWELKRNYEYSWNVTKIKLWMKNEIMNIPGMWLGLNYGWNWNYEYSWNVSRISLWMKNEIMNIFLGCD